MILQTSKFRVLLALTGLFFASSILVETRASAQAAPVAKVSAPAAAVTVSPGVLSATVSKATPVWSSTVKIDNSYETPIRISVEFTGIDEMTNSLVPKGEVDKNLEPSLKLSETDILISARSTKVITVQVTNLPTLSEGGHYATLLLTPYAAGATSDPTKNSATDSTIRTAISVNMFIIKQGDTISLAVAASFTGKGCCLFKIPTTAHMVFTNSGNVHVTPRAVVTVVDNDGATTLSQGTANQNSSLILPGKQLADSTILTSLQTAQGWLPRRMSLQAEYRADGVVATQTVAQYFWYIPPVSLTITLVIAAGLAITGVMLLRAFRLRSRHGKANKSPDAPTSHVKHLEVISSDTTDNIVVHTDGSPRDTKR